MAEGGDRAAGWRTLWVTAAVCAVVLVVVRVLSPSDLTEGHQWRTNAYTIDMLANGRWFLPVDTTGLGATKPPLYNWLSAPLVAVFGPSEATFKFPALLCALATLAATALAAWRVTLRCQGLLDTDPHTPRIAAVTAAFALLANISTMKLAWFARPDMPLQLWLTLAWLAAVEVTEPGQKRPRLWAWTLWLSTGLAGLTKTPAMLLVYPFVAIIASGPGLRATARDVGWAWGPALSLGMVIAWLVPAYLTDPEHFVQTLIVGEAVGHIVDGGRGNLALSLLLDSYKIPFYFVRQFLPWSLVALVALWSLWRERRQWPAVPRGVRAAVWWLLVVAVAFLLVARKRDDRVAIFYPQAAVFVGWWIAAGRWREWRTPRRLAAAMAAITLALTLYYFTGTDAVRHRRGDNGVAFARAVETAVGDDPVAYIGSPEPHVLLLMGRHRREFPDAASLAAYPWVVAPTVPALAAFDPVLVSGYLDKQHPWAPAVSELALYRNSPALQRVLERALGWPEPSGQ